MQQRQKRDTSDYLTDCEVPTHEITIPTDKALEHRRLDLTIRLAEKRRVVIFKVACAWDPLVGTREQEKRMKYQELAADLVNQCSW